MKALFFYISLPFIYAISLLPFRILYFFSDVLYFILYIVVGYRKDVVSKNLKNAFPFKSEEEILKIQNAFYHYFFDLMLETIKILSISKNSLSKRVQFEDTELFNSFFEKQKSVIIVMGHYGNWELAGARFGLDPYHQLIVIYHPLKNNYYNNLMVYMRTRLGNELYTKNETLRGMIRDRDRVTATAFIADQTPSPDGAYWTTFLNQETPVFSGTAKIAHKFDYPIIYVTVNRPKRGYYSLQSELLVEHPANLTENEITELHTKRLEKDILDHPEIWLWTHRRWKHKKSTE